ncbi:class I SAM-dependent methyltransferase [Listeria seeligeri]|uniref:class I SAM-dependent methyltransferase n=1 Tax=Listeria seeligeri TaxID=1640 RepID=UPI00162370E5|nr:class I SAM-dependent methyltransferase [Listeria seeligeri]MBC1578762.1 class I SAM-dependent methyltransferase [Listeria seeligeri]MBC2219269.1 class I SAM-dependent methyltransferase [Listeria seeligeri]
MPNNHYYTNDETLKHNRKTWQIMLKGFNMQFTSDNGVFSKNTVDFGSQVLIESFSLQEVSGKILDVGCGYGPMGLTVAKEFPKSQVDMVDVNLRALELAGENAKLNQITNVRIYESSVYENVADEDYQAIISNPPIRAGKQVVHAILEGAHAHLKIGGELWIVIQKKQGGPSAKAKMETVFGNVEQVTKEKGYFIFKSIKE